MSSRLDSADAAAHTAYAAFDIVAFGSSLGGIDALRTILHALPRDFPSIIVIAQHVGRAGVGALPDILQRCTELPVAHPRTGEQLLPGRVYVAPPDQHFLINSRGTTHLTRSAKVGFCRPAADPLMVSAAACYGPRTLGVVLTGANSDGAVGTQAIKWAGGMSLAQDWHTSVAFAMPRAAIATGCVDLVLPLEAIAPALVALVMAPGAADYLRVPLHAA